MVASGGGNADRDGSDGDLERELDELYGVALDAFIATRDRLARERRASGDRAGATELRGRRKPSRAAWALNRAVRVAPVQFDAVVTAGAALHDAQQRSLEKADADTLRDLTRNRRDAVRAFADVAVAAIGRSGESARAAIEETLNTASLDPSAATRVRAGRLTEELGPVDVFATLDPGPTRTTPAKKAVAPPARVRRSADQTGRAASRDTDLPRVSDTAVSRIETARAEAAAATAELQHAEAAHEQARVALDDAAAAVEQAEDAAAAARRANHNAAERVRDARRRAAHAEQQLHRAEAAAARAEEQH
jgi:hypothetical protein